MPFDGSKASMEAFWRSKGVTASSQIDKLTSMAGYRKLYGDLDRIDQKLEQVRVLCEVFPIQRDSCLDQAMIDWYVFLLTPIAEKDASWR